jgi:hypothetical protein
MGEQSSPYPLWTKEYSEEMHQEAVIGLGAARGYSRLLNVDEITATIEGVGSIKPITEANGTRSLEKCAMLEKWFWNIAIRYPKVYTVW